jgi:RNA polymerase sigma-70 factor (ECF subfamily)
VASSAVHEGIPRPARLTAAIERASRGDADAFDALVSDRIEGVYRLAWSILRSEADATDAVQQAFVTAWRELPRLRDLDRFDAWLGRIVVNVCRDELRRRNRRRVREVPADGGEGQREVADPRASDFETHVGRSDEIRRAFASLSVQQRSILVLHHVEGRSIQEIATVLAIPSGTAKWRLFSARQALERALAEAER